MKTNLTILTAIAIFAAACSSDDTKPGQPAEELDAAADVVLDATNELTPADPDAGTVADAATE